MEQRRRGLIQHRIYTPKRQVPYPKNHPLARHLQEQSLNSEEDVQKFEEIQVIDSIVGGDGWRSQKEYREWRRLHIDTNKSLNTRTFQSLKDSPTFEVGSEYHRKFAVGDTLAKNPEEVREGKLYNQGGILRYWTVTGRNLVNDLTNETSEVSNVQLLVDLVTEFNHDNTNWTEDRVEKDDEYNETIKIIGDTDSKPEHDALSNDAIEKNEDEINTSKAKKISLYQPIRLRAIFTDDESSGSKYLTALQRKKLMEDMINPALYAWSQALHVIPVGSHGGEEGQNLSNSTLVVDQSQLYDSVSCGPGIDSGLPSVIVPFEHMTEGLAETDTVIYVSVSFTNKASNVSSIDKAYRLNNLRRVDPEPVFRGTRVDANSTSIQYKVDDANHSDVPSVSPSDQPSLTPSETEPFVESRPICPGSYLASATYCSSDQYDRPVAGILSMCIDDLHTFFNDKVQMKRNIVTIMHEIGHILGFNAQSLAHFRDGDTGKPLTPRDVSGDVVDVEVECTGISPLPRSKIPLPSSNIIDFVSVRGGLRVATIVTPTVQRMARNIFGCQSLTGAELSSGEGQLFLEDIDDSLPLSAGECIGDHWQRRLFRTDLLNPIVDDVPFSLYISSLTLAYFADSGWYKVNTDRIAPSSVWGRNAGCDFVNQKCVTYGRVTASNSPYFCNNLITTTSQDEEIVMEIHGCDLESSSKAVCAIGEFDSELPNEYNYFSNSKSFSDYHFGGKDPTLDYCPVFERFSNGHCKDLSAKKYVGVRNSMEVFGEDNSRCVIGSVDKQRTALCLPIACVIQDQTLMVKVDGIWKSCLYAGQIISVWWNRNDYVVCPDPSHLCPTFYCPNDCFREGGICDFISGQCMCTSEDKFSANSTSWLSHYRPAPLLEPCDALNYHTNTTFHVTERNDAELPEYYVINATLLLDDPRDFDDKVSRMFSQMNSGDVVGLVASFMLFVVFFYLIWYQLMRCYKEPLHSPSLSKVRISVSSLSSLLRNASRSTSNNSFSNDIDSRQSRQRTPSRNPQKDKMVATLLVQNRIAQSDITEQKVQLNHLHTVGLSQHTLDEAESGEAETVVNLSLTTNHVELLNRSELPPLPGGKIITVIGAHIVEDDHENEDAQSSITSATNSTSQSALAENNFIPEYSSPLYEDEGGQKNNRVQRCLRLRHFHSTS